MSVLCDSIANWRELKIESSPIGKPKVSTDEMNIFIPQSAITQYELLHIADAKIQVITPGTSKPLITLV